MKKSILLILSFLLIQALIPSTAFASESNPIATNEPNMDEYVVIENPIVDNEINGDATINSNRYYYIVKQTGTSRDVDFTISNAQAVGRAALEAAIKTAILTAILGVGGTAIMAARLATAFATSLVSDNAAGRYTGIVYKVTKYRVDTLTGKKSKVNSGVRTKLTHAGTTYTRTTWDK